MNVYEVCDKYGLPYSIIESIYSSLCEGGDMVFEEAVKIFVAKLSAVEGNSDK